MPMGLMKSSSRISPGTPVSREALYEEVWTDAVTVIAPRYGLSDVGLVKICR